MGFAGSCLEAETAENNYIRPSGISEMYVSEFDFSTEPTGDWSGIGIVGLDLSITVEDFKNGAYGTTTFDQIRGYSESLGC